METNVKERITAKIAVDGQPKTITLEVEQRFPDGTALYVNKDYRVYKFVGNGLRAALKTFKVFTRAISPESDPFTTMAGIRASELLDMLNDFEELENSELI